MIGQSSIHHQSGDNAIADYGRRGYSSAYEMEATLSEVSELNATISEADELSCTLSEAEQTRLFPKQDDSLPHNHRDLPPYTEEPPVHVSPRVRAMSGNFVQPSGAFAQSSGAFAQPSSSLSQSIAALQSGAFALFAEEYKEISGEYRVGEPIGRGGCAIVLEAWRLSDNLHVVIKVLQVNSGIDEKETHIAIERFMREAKLIASLHEEHIVRCVDYGSFQGTPCMVLEFVDGLSLDKFLEKYGAIPLKFATGIIEQLLSALVETHSKKIIHRDIKPGNIMVFDSPPPYEIRVLDFGISSVLDGFQSKTLMTQQGNVRGTPSYMAPELFTGETRASIESDLYAVGLVYLECLTGEIAINDKSFMRVAYKQVNEQLEIPGNIPPSIADIIFKLCAKKVEDRYHSAQVVLDDIHSVIEQALRDEEKCFKAWEKSQKKKHKQKRKNSQTQQITAQRLISTRNLPKLIGLILLVAGLCCIPILAFYHLMSKKNQQAEPETKIVTVPAPVDAKAEKLRELEAEASRHKTELTLTRAGIQTTSTLVGTSWEKANSAVDTAINKESSSAPPSPQPKNQSKKTSGKTQTRPDDTRVGLPF
ncbi:MAG: serine/threonine protein kinase [Proteobacteria bacterium]|nr:serine/threonine protein kinase [Pseudomonadota bacterium]